jgi:glycosyltransferase involved in cell wall biosynthesis
MKVAVCIASYNRAEFLPELFESIKSQTFKDFQVYIGYDGSTDNSLEVIEGWLHEFPMTIVDYEETARIGLNKHRVVARALEDNPDLIQMLDSDDKIEPTFLERSVETIGDADWLMCWGKCFGEREGTIEGKIIPLAELARHNTLHSWGMFKAHVLRKHNYREDLAFAEDWNLWLRLAKAGYQGVILDEHLYLQRWHKENLNLVHKYNYAEMRGRVLEDLDILTIARPYRFHLLGLVHLPVSERYMACAFTQKIVKLSKMLLSLGHEVFLYGAESSDAPCTEFFETHTLNDIRDEWGSGDNRHDIGYNWKKFGFRHDFNKPRTRTTLKYHQRASMAINRHKQPDDFLLLMQGQYQKPIADNACLYLTCEPGIGYRGSIRPSEERKYTQGPFRAFESAYLQNFTYGSENPGLSINGSYYDRVIPNYFEPKDFPFVHQKDDYFFYIGRMIGRKGVLTAIDTTRAIGAKLILAGQEDDEVPVSSLPPHCKFVGYVEPEERAEWLGHARASFVPTLYLEAFGGTNVEAQLCGTPAITTNFGVFPETVVHGVTGFRCDTMADFVDAARNAHKLNPKKIRRHAERYLTTNIKWEFQKWFDDLYQLYLSAVDPRWKGRGWSYIS